MPESVIWPESSLQVGVFWVVTLYSVTVGYQHFGGYCWRWRQHYTVSQPRRPPLESSLPWKPQISHQNQVSFQLPTKRIQTQIILLCHTRCCTVQLELINCIAY